MVEREFLLLVRTEARNGLSHLSAARSKDGETGWRIDAEPTFLPSPTSHPEEQWGVEDPRLTRLEDQKRWAVAYTAYSQVGPLVSLALTEDFKDFERLGPVLPPENKDAALFPVRFKGRYGMIHRPVPKCEDAGAHMWISFSPDLKHWGDHQLLIPARHGGWWDANKIGIGPPPIETPDGWLILYHGVRRTVSGAIYRLGVALLDLEDPTRVLRRSDQWIFGPETGYERTGDVDDVVFSCGWIAKDDILRIYYGGADTQVALATVGLKDLLDYVKQCPDGTATG